MNILVLQLARLGDILQTLPAIQGLKRKHPNAKITLVTRATFADAAKICPHVDKLIEFSSKEILGPYLNSPTHASKQISFNALKKWISNNFSNEQYDLLLNLTFSSASSYLASLIPAKEIRGMYRSRDGQANFLASDAWSQYFFAQVFEKILTFCI